MGVYHLAPVGTSPGAVTSALAFLKQNMAKAEFTVRDGIAEAVILFPSWDVREGNEGIPEECVLNDYGQENKRRCWKRGSAVIDTIRDFMETEFGRQVALYCSPVNANDYDDCFGTIGRVVLKLSSGTGKHLWANLTGGTNIINMALLEVAYLSGLIARLYYCFLSDVRRYGMYLRPPSPRRDVFDWREVPFVKTSFDSQYYRVIQLLEQYGDWLEDKELFGWVRKEFENSGNVVGSLEQLRRDFLNKMDGREIEREELPDKSRTHRNRVSDYGRLMLERVNKSELFQVLLRPNLREREIVERLTGDLRLERIGSGNPC